MSTSNPFSVGPGSQPEEEDAVLEYMALPEAMATWHRPVLPEPGDVKGMEKGLAALEQVLEALRHFKLGQPAFQVDVSDLDEKSRAFVDDVLGEGEVSIIAGTDLQAQESVLAGVWRVRTAAEPGKPAADVIEVGHIPSRVHEIAFRDAHRGVRPPAGKLVDGLLAAPSLLAELHNAVTSEKGDAAQHAINLSLLPHSEEDLVFLDEQLGKGVVHILSRGYGNCRISSTATRNIWWVRYYNSQDTLILNALEVADIPDVAFAAVEDVHDSEKRLAEILDVYR